MSEPKQSVSQRDFPCYRGKPPNPHWPNGARVAVSLVVNFEEGSEFSINDGDAGNEAIYEVVHRLDGPDSCIEDRKSTRLNSSHVAISYAVFCLKKKKHYIGYFKQQQKKNNLIYRIGLNTANKTRCRMFSGGKKRRLALVVFLFFF